MAEAGRYRLLCIPCSPNKLVCIGCLSRRGHREMVVDTPPPQPEERSHLGSNAEAGRRLAPEAADPSPLAQPAFRRQTPEVRAVCIKGACTDPGGGRGATRVPTATRWSKRPPRSSPSTAKPRAASDLTRLEELQ